MMNFLSRLFGHSPDSAQVAKQRLQMVLVQDRTNISPEVLGILKDEIVDVISQHVEIDREHVDVSITRSGNEHRLVANIPVLDAHPPQPAPAARRSARATHTRKAR